GRSQRGIGAWAPAWGDRRKATGPPCGGPIVQRLRANGRISGAICGCGAQPRGRGCRDRPRRWAGGGRWWGPRRSGPGSRCWSGEEAGLGVVGGQGGEEGVDVGQEGAVDG